jgi:hypothetical protein
MMVPAVMLFVVRVFSFALGQERTSLSINYRPDDN